MSSHVFVVRGDLLHMNLDAWMLPSDRRYTISDAWRRVSGISNGVARTNSAEFEREERFALPLKSWRWPRALPVLTATPHKSARDTFEIGRRIEDFVHTAAEAVRQRRQGRAIDPDARILLGMTIFPSSGRTDAASLGELLEAQMAAARHAASAENVDVVLVLDDERTFALAQMIRSHDRKTAWPEIAKNRKMLRHAESLGRHARDGRLVPFMGAGVNASSVTPSWEQTVEALAEGADLSDAERQSLQRDSDPLDQLAFLRSVYDERRDGSFEQAISEIVGVKNYGLAPALLASLKSPQAFTLNVDRLFEIAAEDIGDPRTVVPGGRRVGAPWLYKLLGSVDDPASIALLVDSGGSDGIRATVRALVAASAAGNHLLFVGFGTGDRSFHGIAHDVRAALPKDADAAAQATALTLRDDPLDRRLWEGRLALVPMAGADASDGDATRALEVYLDAVLAFATDSRSYALSPGFREVLPTADAKLAAVLGSAASALTDDMTDAAAYARVTALLRDLGWEG
ncbi:SIR2-like domain-containing protein [Paramicrobacterium humi]|uniref:SIR2-like domain-containing protein n=1 Tax=Paramicrobacterium humi TaxID=640635 RepID=A0A1H4KR25_9MICO|nr:SIR2 family protein [Microbacterium humi]SEB60957.1 SIR2-like domain-containing protein [Microbacterium humi]